MAGAEQGSALLQAVAVGGTNLVFTMAAMLIIDHFGRRKLMLVGSIGYIVSLGGTAWAFYTYGDAFGAAAEALKSGAAVPPTWRPRRPSAARSCWSACCCSSPRTPSARGR